MNFLRYLYFNGEKNNFPLIFFRIAGYKEEDPQPSTSGTNKEK